MKFVARPSLTDLAFLLPAALLFGRLSGARQLLGDGDTGWHIRTGDWILSQGRVPQTDIFSFTRAGQPWFAWEWFADVVFAWLHQRGGMAAVVLSSILILSLTSALLFRLVRRSCGNALIATVVTMAATTASSLHWLARPHLFTFLFCVIFYSILERARGGDAHLLWWLPLLTVLWVNLHAGFFIGVVLIGTYAVGELAGWLIEPHVEAQRVVVPRGRNYALCAAGCILASFANPYFYRLHLHIYNYLTDSDAYSHIAEFQSANFHHPLAVVFEPMILLAVVGCFWSLLRKRWVHALLLISWTHMALISARNIPILMVVAAPIVALNLNGFLSALHDARVAGWLKDAVREVQELGAEFSTADRMGHFHLTSAVAMLLLAAVFYRAGNLHKFQADYDPKKYPAAAFEVLRNGTIFTSDEWGDYLIYRGFPDVKVFVDGRSDFYGPEFNQKYMEVLNAQPGWEESLSRYGVDTILLPLNASLAGALRECSRWRPVYEDSVAVVFRVVKKNSGASGLAAPQGQNTNRVGS